MLGRKDEAEDKDAGGQRMEKGRSSSAGSQYLIRPQAPAVVKTDITRLQFLLGYHFFRYRRTKLHTHPRAR